MRVFLSGSRTGLFADDAIAMVDDDLQRAGRMSMPRWLSEQVGAPGWVLVVFVVVIGATFLIRRIRLFGEELRQLLLTVAGVFRGCIEVRDAWRDLHRHSLTLRRSPTKTVFAVSPTEQTSDTADHAQSRASDEPRQSA